jgi:protein involved in polysaccharide export with SLBB domain
MWFKKILFIVLLFPLAIFAQNANVAIQNQALSEAKALNITTQQQALDALKQKGIDENQARQMARMRGIDFDSFLKSNFTSSPALAASTAPVILSDAGTVVSTPIIVGNIQDNAQTTITKAEADKFFGYDIFLNNPFAQKEYLVGNIDEGYIIAPGDVLRLVVFGDNTMQLEAKVDLNGNINIPNFGMIMVSGSSFATLKTRLKTYLGKYFSGLLTSPQRTFLDVSLTQIRPVNITVLGEAGTPGPHLVSGLATVLNALYASGGVKTSGSLRSIKVYRNNQLLKEIDLYDYITSGKLDNDVRLANNDIIFIAPRISSITLSGAVKNAAVYELKNGEGLNELIKFSAGLPSNASINNVVINRITPFDNREQKRVYDRFLTSIDYSKILKQKNNFILENGDKVVVSSILDKSLNQVQITGNVNKEGFFPLDKFSDLKDLIVKAAENLKPNTYFGKVDIFKEDLEGKRKFLTYNLSPIMDGSLKVKLENDDQVRIYNVNNILGEKQIKISGFGTDAKTIFWRENLNLFDLIFQSTSFEELEFQSKLLSSRIDVKRFDLKTGLFNILTYNLDDLISIKQVKLYPKDEVVLYSRAVTEILNKSVTIDGYINNPGKINLNNNMSVEDAILASGGFKEYANQDSVIVNREDFDYATSKLSQKYNVLLDVDYLKGIKKVNENKFQLQNNDIITVRKKIGVEPKKTIRIEGEVVYPSTLILENELVSLSKVIENVGGLKKNANLEASYIIREGKVLSLNLNDILNNNNNILKDLDIIHITSSIGTVQTIGALHNENQFIWEKGYRAKYYIRNSGGKVWKEADYAYVILPNGKTKSINLFRNPIILPDSKIIVTRKIKEVDNNKTSAMDNFVKIITLISGSLTAAVLATKL